MVCRGGSGGGFHLASISEVGIQPKMCIERQLGGWGCLCSPNERVYPENQFNSRSWPRAPRRHCLEASTRASDGKSSHCVYLTVSILHLWLQWSFLMNNPDKEVFIITIFQLLQHFSWSKQIRTNMFSAISIKSILVCLIHCEIHRETWKQFFLLLLLLFSLFDIKS